MVATQPDMNLVAEASNGREAIQQFRQHHPDITDAKIIMLTTYESDFQNAVRMGARAYLLKAQLDKQLLGTIRAVQAGK